MRYKNCPYCRSKLSFIELLLLDEHSASKCKKCGNFLKNSFVNSIIAAVIPALLCGLSIYLFDINLLYSLSLLLLIPVLRISLAEPLRFNANSNSRTCLQCRRTNAVFKDPFSTVCSDCQRQVKKQSAEQAALREKQ
jgi:hypothetical protein